MQVSLAWVVSRALLGRVSYEHGAAGLWPYLGADAPSALSRHGDGLFLLPLFDMINHSSDAAARSTVLRHLAVRAVGDKEAGVEKGTGAEAEAETEAEAGAGAGAEAGLRCVRRGGSRRARRCYTRTARTVAWPEWPGSQPPVQPPTAQEGPPLAQL